MARIARPHPVTFTADWPDSAIDDVPAETARLLAIRLRRTMANRSAREVGRLCGVDSTTVSAILNGTTWPDLRTIALLEHGLGARLWPSSGP